MPPATTGPGPSIEPPSALTPLTVVKSRFVSNVQRIVPSALAYARMAPSAEPENTTPGIEVSAADWAELQPGPALHTAVCGGAYHARWPVIRFTACKPPGSGVSWSAT